MLHPWAKMRRDVNLTQARVATELNIDRLSVIRYEQGMFGHLSDELVDSLATLYRTDPDLLVLEYRGYQRLKRLEFKERYLSWRYLSGYMGLPHPLIYYRDANDLSRNGLCKGLCLDYGPVSNYEANKQRSIPEIIKIASDDMGWDWTYLESAVLEWRSSGRSSSRDIK
jgi:DNA-binding XRE family transcriptional regulator